MTGKLKKVGQDNSVSVIIPTFNRSNFLISAIKSVLNQTYPIYEILVCDDGSTDNSKILVKNFKDNRVKWLAGKHTGLPAIPRNRGIRNASGKWIAFLDSDDWWNKDKLRKQIDALATSNNLASCTAIKRIRDKKEVGPGPVFTKHNICFAELKNINYITCSSVLIDRQLLAKVGMFSDNQNLKSIEDYELWIRISCYYNFIYIKDPCVNYTEGSVDSVRSVFRSNEVGKQRKLIWKSVYKWAKTQSDISIYRKLDIWLRFCYYKIWENS